MNKHEHSHALIPFLQKGLAEWLFVSSEMNFDSAPPSKLSDEVNSIHPEMVHLLASIIIHHQQQEVRHDSF